MAQMVRQTNKPIYDQMCRKMDEYNDALRVGAEAQKLYDRGVRPDDDVEAVHYGGNGNINGKYGNQTNCRIDNDSEIKNSKISHDRHNSTDSDDNNTNNGENGSTSIQPTKINKKCRYGSNCYKLAKGTCPYRHPEVVAHVAQIDDDNNGYTFDGYTYYDFSEREQ